MPTSYSTRHTFIYLNIWLCSTLAIKLPFSRWIVINITYHKSPNNKSNLNEAQKWMNCIVFKCKEMKGVSVTCCQCLLENGIHQSIQCSEITFKPIASSGYILHSFFWGFGVPCQHSPPTRSSGLHGHNSEESPAPPWTLCSALSKQQWCRILVGSSSKKT